MGATVLVALLAMLVGTYLASRFQQAEFSLPLTSLHTH